MENKFENIQVLIILSKASYGIDVIYVFVTMKLHDIHKRCCCQV